jgi:heme/copper-type cytochrome/quinol oxidase subunit 2
MNFQEPATDTMHRIVDLHHDIMFYLVGVVLFVLYMLIMIVWRFRASNRRTVRARFTHYPFLEKA